MNLIVLRGYPGSGKSTLGKLLEKNGVGKFVDHNGVLNELVGSGGTDEGRYEEIHQQEQALVRTQLANGSSAIIARGFTAWAQVEPYLTIAKDGGATPRVFRLNVPQEILGKRVMADERFFNAMSLNNPHELGQWISKHRMEVSKEEFVLDGTKPPEALVDEIRENL